jgi:SnoaL-like domain
LLPGCVEQFNLHLHARAMHMHPTVLELIPPMLGELTKAAVTRLCRCHLRAPGAEREIEMEDHDIRAALDRHWAASDANEFEAEHEIYREDAVLEYPQSGERIRGRRNILASRFAQPNRKRFTVRRILGTADLWITELVIAYDARPSYTVSIMEFRDGKVARETQYFGDPFEPGPSRAQWVERMR